MNQKQKNKLIELCESEMARVEQELLDIGITGTTENLIENENLLAYYDYLQHKISDIQFNKEIEN